MYLKYLTLKSLNFLMMFVYCPVVIFYGLVYMCVFMYVVLLVNDKKKADTLMLTYGDLFYRHMFDGMLFFTCSREVRALIYYAEHRVKFNRTYTNEIRCVIYSSYDKFKQFYQTYRSIDAVGGMLVVYDDIYQSQVEILKSRVRKISELKFYTSY